MPTGNDLVLGRLKRNTLNNSSRRAHAGVHVCVTQADSAPLDLQDGDVTSTDALIKSVQKQGVPNPAQLAMQAGKKQDPSVQAPLTAFQNILLVRFAETSEIFVAYSFRASCILVHQQCFTLLFLSHTCNGCLRPSYYGQIC